MASFTKEVNQPLAKRPLVFNGRLANRWFTSLVKEATGAIGTQKEQVSVIYITEIRSVIYMIPI